MEVSSEGKSNHQLLSTTARILHQNVDRISNKIERLNHALDIHHPDILIVTEHGMNEESLSNVHLLNYNLVASFSRKDHKKGGVAIYACDNLANLHEQTNINQFSKELLCELAGIKIKLNNKRDLYILGVYRPPDALLEEALVLLSDSLSTIPFMSADICLVGDFNVDNIHNSKGKTALNEMLASLGMYRISLPATRVTHTTQSSIDIVCSNLENELIRVDVIDTYISDHTGQLCTLKIPLKRVSLPVSTRRRLNNSSLLHLRETLASQSWDEVIQEVDVDIAYTKFIGLVTAALNHACPYQTSRNRLPKKNFSYDHEANELRKVFFEAQEKYNSTGKSEDKADYLTKKKAYDLSLRRLRQKHNEELIAESANKNKTIWRVINSERASKRPIKNSAWALKVNEETISCTESICQHFNRFFVNIAEEALKVNASTRKDVKLNTESRPQQLLLHLQPASQQEVKRIINSTKPSSSVGVDDISSRVMKFCQNELLFPLTSIINKSFVQGVFPSKMKTSKVYPLHKKGKTDEIQNYRPISLVTTFSKIVERIVLIRLRSHLQANKINLEEQHGFIPGRSTTTALNDIIENMIDNLDAGKSTINTFLDLSKAFDSLDHNLILKKLYNIGIVDTAHRWFKSYLSDRMQMVELRETVDGTTRAYRSESLMVKRGVPQGSVLGPVLFALFTADLPTHLQDYCKAVMYADDTVLQTSSSLADQLEVANFIAVSLSQEYCINNDLVFNEDKTTQLILGRCKEDVSGPPNIQTVSSTKHLGVIIDDRLSWHDHINSLCLKLSSAIFAIKRIQTISTPEAAKLSYYALFESHVRYGIVFWGGSSQENLQRVLILQKQVLRILANLQPRQSCRDAFRNLGILTAVSIYISEAVLHTCKLCPLARNGEIHTYNTRSANDFNLPLHRTTLYSKKPSYAGAKYFNLLPTKVKDGPANGFRRRLRQWLAEEPVYCMEEFKTRVRDSI